MKQCGIDNKDSIMKKLFLITLTSLGLMVALMSTVQAQGPQDTVGIWQQTAGTYQIEGRALRFFMWNQPMTSTTGIISDDGSTITIITKAANGYESRQVYRRQR